MTTLALALACACLAAADGDDEEMTMSLDEVVELIEPFGESCKPQPQRENIVEMIKNTQEAKYETKCFRQCMLEQFELMPEGQLKFNEDKTLEMMNMMFPNQEKDSPTIIKSCNDQVSSKDKCEVAHDISMCMLGAMRQQGYKIPDIKE
ncbi:uncharacterized protein LOC121405270 [Drosophila obscura]|uniref:uncharacterized protein LOC121405270 n=1 Tax=Drosophila obscura TaxID=7282 RepID=UPI001BB29A1B|nr:uncharacterized protein LOC121405270 [Drosophila obscura]